LIGGYKPITDSSISIVYLNFKSTSSVRSAPSLNNIPSTFKNGIAINGDVYIANIEPSSLSKLTVIGDAEITQQTKLLDVEINGVLNAKNAILQWSDSNLKNDIRPIDDALGKVLQMNGRTFLMNNSVDNAREIGLVAQEVAPIFPEVVRKSTGGNLAVAYGNLAGVFVEAIKELTGKVESLTTTVSILQSELAKMKALP